ncbi:RNA polymerase sigma factor [Larkinella insperata]|uniref:RNA polymerase sigma factor n=1 Tax=Larkinella insperata TaxID=332158 RepID=A0ABW3QHC9_9BACT
MTDEDKLLWATFRKGDRDAFEGLLRAYYKSLLDYGFHFIKDRDILKDLVHDLFLNLWERRTFLNPDVTHLKPYLFKSLKHQIVNYLQKNTNHASLPEIWQEKEPICDNYIESSLIEQETLLANESRLQLALSQLSKRQREILHLKYFESLSHEQIADVMAISPQAVRNLLSQSLKSIREHWGFLFIALYHFLR